MKWKFARTRLWMYYVGDVSPLPPPFNLVPVDKAACCIRWFAKRYDCIKKVSTNMDSWCKAASSIIQVYMFHHPAKSSLLKPVCTALAQLKHHNRHPYSPFQPLLGTGYCGPFCLQKFGGISLASRGVYEHWRVAIVIQDVRLIVLSYTIIIFKCLTWSSNTPT